MTRFPLAVLLVIVLFIFSATSVNAHPGNTASDGCHYCRTNCDKWGVPWNERHCHGGTPNTNSTTQQVAPTPVIQPTIKPTTKPTVKPTVTPNPSPTPSITPIPSIEPSPITSSQPEVLGTKTKGEDGNTWMNLTILGLLVGGLYLGFRKIKGKLSRRNEDKEEI